MLKFNHASNTFVPVDYPDPGQPAPRPAPRRHYAPAPPPPEPGLCSPTCPICHGVGYVRYDLPLSDPNFGKMEPCPNMYQVNLIKGATRYGLAPDEIETLDWPLILPINDGPAAAEVVKEVLGRRYGLVYLWGSHGQAKTLILKIATAVALRGQVEAAYVNMTDLLSNLRLAYDSEYPNYDSERRLEYWRSLPVLCIDEFNRVKETPYVQEKRFALMDRRQVQAIRQETVTLIASNTPPGDQESYLASRFGDGRFKVITLTADDARPAMQEDFKY